MKAKINSLNCLILRQLYLSGSKIPGTGQFLFASAKELFVSIFQESAHLVLLMEQRTESFHG